jgi:hypothetical protein
MNVFLFSMLAWRVAALTVWLAIAIGAADVIAHVLRAQPHRRRAVRR